MFVVGLFVGLAGCLRSARRGFAAWRFRPVAVSAPQGSSENPAGRTPSGAALYLQAGGGRAAW